MPYQSASTVNDQITARTESIYWAVNSGLVRFHLDAYSAHIQLPKTTLSLKGADYKCAERDLDREKIDGN